MKEPMRPRGMYARYWERFRPFARLDPTRTRRGRQLSLTRRRQRDHKYEVCILCEHYPCMCGVDF